MMKLSRLVEKTDRGNVSSGIIFIVPDKPYRVTLYGQGYDEKERIISLGGIPTGPI